MVEKMKMVHIVTSASAKDEMIKSLRDIGVMHLAEKQSADREVTDRFSTLSKTQMALKYPVVHFVEFIVREDLACRNLLFLCIVLKGHLSL